MFVGLGDLFPDRIGSTGPALQVSLRVCKPSHGCIGHMNDKYVIEKIIARARVIKEVINETRKVELVINYFWHIQQAQVEQVEQLFY